MEDVPEACLVQLNPHFDALGVPSQNRHAPCKLTVTCNYSMCLHGVLRKLFW